MAITGEYDFNNANPALSIWKDFGFEKRSALGELFHRVEGVTRASDVAVRAAIYDQTLSETGDAALAQGRAREFINFRRRGSAQVLPTLTAVIPFLNAYLQGMDVLYRAATGKGASAGTKRAEARKLFWSKASTVMAMTAIYSLLASDDDEYKRISRDMQFGNWILPGGAKIPVPTELAAVFKVPIELGLEFFKREGTPEEVEAAELTHTALKYAFEQYIGRTAGNVLGISAATKPILEAFTNMSFFTGRELIGVSLKGVDAREQYRPSTSELAKAVSNFGAEMFGGATVSPILIDNFLRGWFGTMAGNVIMLGDALINPDRLDRPLYKMPFLSTFMYGEEQMTRTKDEFYDANNKAAQKANTLNKLAKTDPSRVDQYMKDNAEALALDAMGRTISNQLTSIREARTYYQSPRGMADYPDQEYRKARLEELRAVEEQLMDAARRNRVLIHRQFQ